MKCLLITFPPEPLVQIQNYFTELFLMMASTKIVQTVSLSLIQGSPELQIRNIFKRNLSKPLVQTQNYFTELFLMIPSTKIEQMVLLRPTKRLQEL